MTSVNWSLSDNQTLAEYVPLDTFTGLLQNRIGISPDHVALLMRDGEVVDAFVGAHFAIGGVWQRLKETLGGTHAVRLLVADLKPFQIQGEIEAISQDGVPIGATVAIEFQVDPERPKNILGLMREHGALTKPDVYERVLPHLRDRVFGAALGKVTAGDIRGNVPLQDKIQADILLEVQRLMQDVGLLVRAASMTWALSEAERAALQRSAAGREQEMLDYQFQCRKREIQRAAQTTEFELQSEVDIEKLKASSEDEVRHLILRQELGFIDARDAGVRAQEMKKLDHELAVLGVKRRAGYEQALEDAQNDVDRAVIRRKLTEVDLEIDAMKQEQRLRLARLEEEQALALAAEARRLQMASMRDLSEIELVTRERVRKIDRDDRVLDHDLILRDKQQASVAEMERLKVQATMTSDQILAISAGLSPEVAKVFVERARVMSIDAEKREALLREMLQLTSQGRMASEEQARFFFDKAMQAIPASHTTSVHVGSAAGDTIECPGCHRMPPRTDRFCRFCGQALRT